MQQVLHEDHHREQRHRDDAGGDANGARPGGREERHPLAIEYQRGCRRGAREHGKGHRRRHGPVGGDFSVGVGREIDRRRAGWRHELLPAKGAKLWMCNDHLPLTIGTYRIRHIALLLLLHNTMSCLLAYQRR